MNESATPTVSLVILGGDGDLAKRLLLPGLGTLLERVDDRIELIGAGLSDLGDDEWHSRVDGGLEHVPDERRERLLAHTKYVRADLTDAASVASLIATCTARPILYFALPPAVTAKVCAALETIDVPDGLRLALEKPFGTDADSAHALNRLLSRIVPESQTFRVDHFRGKSTVLNLLGLRFANRVFAPIWNADTIERVDITYDEALGLEGRAGYYDHSGALVDMIQSHLLEVLALFAMEPITSVDEQSVRGGISDVLSKTSAWHGDPVAASRRARYTAGAVDGRSLPSYADEHGVDANRGTETLAELTVGIDTDRWRGVPFMLRSGKALSGDRTTARATFAPAIALDGLHGTPQPDSIEIDLDSGEVRLQLTMNGAGDPFDLEQATFIAHQQTDLMGAYGEVLHGIISGDPMLSVRGDTAERCWQIVDPVLAAWRSGEVPLDEYAAGSHGPEGWAAT